MHKPDPQKARCPQRFFLWAIQACGESPIIGRWVSLRSTHPTIFFAASSPGRMGWAQRYPSIHLDRAM